jgi:hypothetical protein
VSVNHLSHFIHCASASPVQAGRPIRASLGLCRALHCPSCACSYFPTTASHIGKEPASQSRPPEIPYPTQPSCSRKSSKKKEKERRKAFAILLFPAWLTDVDLHQPHRGLIYGQQLKTKPAMQSPPFFRTRKQTLMASNLHNFSNPFSFEILTPSLAPSLPPK